MVIVYDMDTWVKKTDLNRFIIPLSMGYKTVVINRT